MDELVHAATRANNTPLFERNLVSGPAIGWRLRLSAPPAKKEQRSTAAGGETNRCGFRNRGGCANRKVIGIHVIGRSAIGVSNIQFEALRITRVVAGGRARDAARARDGECSAGIARLRKRQIERRGGTIITPNAAT